MKSKGKDGERWMSVSHSVHDPRRLLYLSIPQRIYRLTSSCHAISLHLSFSNKNGTIHSDSTSPATTLSSCLMPSASQELCDQPHTPLVPSAVPEAKPGSSECRGSLVGGNCLNHSSPKYPPPLVEEKKCTKFAFTSFPTYSSHSSNSYAEI